MDICHCWKLSHISPVFPRVPLLVNTPAVRTKWTRASEMSNLLKGEMSRHEHNLSTGSRAYPTAAFWLMSKNRQTSQFSLSKHIWMLWMTYGGRNNTSPRGGEAAQLACLADGCHPRRPCHLFHVECREFHRHLCPVAERTAREITQTESSLRTYRIHVRQREKRLGVHVLRVDIDRVGGIGSPSRTYTPDPHIRSTCYYSKSLNRQITFHTGTMSVSLQSRR